MCELFGCFSCQKGNIVNNYELENATKSIFLHYLNEPDVLDMIRKNLSNPSEVCVDEDNQIQQCVSLSKKSNPTESQLNEKLNMILENQKKIENLINFKIHTENEEQLLPKLENIKMQYDADLTRITQDKNKEIDQYKKELKEYKDQNGTLTFENESLKKENNELKTEMRNIEEKCRLEMAKYSVFEESLEVLNCINALNFENRGYIESLCGGLDVLATLSLGRDDGKIEQLWCYIRDLAIKGDVEKIEVLKLNRYFEFCLKVANSTKVENEKYIMLNIEPDSEFDIDTCIRTSDSKQIGKIRDILVKSVKVGKNVKYKAIVRVE